MNRLNSLLSAGVKLTSTGTAVASPIPFDSSGYFPRFVRVVASGAGCYVKVGDIGVTAVSGDCMVQPLDGVVLNVAGCKAISAISVSGTSSVTVVPLERGSWNYDQRTLDYDFTTLSAVPSPVTATRGSGGGYFGSDGLFKWQGYNLLTYSQDFSNGAWTKNDVTVTTGQSSYYGGSTACLMTEGSAGTAFTNQNATAVTAGSTISCYLVVKKGNTDWVRVVLAETTATDGATAWFNLTTGIKGSTSPRGAGTSISSSQTSLGNGWYLCAVTCIPNGSYTIPYIGFVAAASDAVTTRVSGATYVISGVQLERGSTASQYSPTTTAANSAPRLDYDPATLLPRGLLVEEQRVNLLLQSGTMTTSWTLGRATNGGTSNVAPDGTASALKLVEDSTATNTHYTFQSVAKSAAAIQYTYSVFLKAGERTWAQIAIGLATGAFQATVYINLSTGALGTTASGLFTGVSAATPVSVGGGWWRCSITATTDTALTVVGAVALATGDGGNSYTGNGTSGLYAWGSQLEAGSFPTSYIPTTTASATRSADSVSMTGTNFSSWFNAIAGTFVVEFDVARSVNATVNSGVVGAGTGARFAYNPATGTQLSTWDGTTQLTTANSLSYNATTKVASSYTAGASRSICLNGGTVATTATCAAAYTAGTALYIGDFQSGSNTQLNGHIRRVQFYPVALPSATLQSLTS